MLHPTSLDHDCIQCYISIVSSDTGFIIVAPQELNVCQWTSAVLSCPLFTTLRVLSANWGRTTANVCGYNAVTVCRLDVTSKVQARCQGKNHCSLKASASLGPDPCLGVSKYLNISYVCEEGKQRLIKEVKSFVFIHSQVNNHHGQNR